MSKFLDGTRPFLRSAALTFFQIRSRRSCFAQKGHADSSGSYLLKRPMLIFFWSSIVFSDIVAIIELTYCNRFYLTEEV